MPDETATHSPAATGPDPTRSADDPPGDVQTNTQPPADRTAPYAADSSPADATLDPVPGYELLGPLGEGGMGVVYQARQIALGRVVALKMLLRGSTAGPAAAARFLAEAEAVPAVDHPHVVRVHDFAAAGGRPYLAMEFCPGGTLADRLKASGGLQPAVEAARLLEKIARGVAAAHAAGVVHRDVKPANVLFDAAGEPKVADFGLAKRDGGSDLTRTAAVMGTPHYMAPEQADGRAKFAGPPADVWALGAVLYECLTGTRPFDAADPVAILHRVRHDDPPRPRSLAPAVPRDLELVALKCLEKDPADRYPTAAELAADLGRFLAGEPISVRPAGPAERLAKWARRKPTLAAAYALAALAAVLSGLGGLAGWQWHRAESANAQLAGEKAAVEVARDAETTARERMAAAKERLTAVEYGRTVELAYQAWQDHQVAVARRLLAGTPEHLRGWEYGYVNRLCHPAHLELTISGDPGRVSVASARFSRDGRFLVTTSCEDGPTLVRVWDAVSGKELRCFKGTPYTVRNASFSPDGRRVMVGSGNGYTIWDATTGDVCYRSGSKDLDAVFSPDGRHIVAWNYNDSTARLRDAVSGAELVTFVGHKAYIISATFSPDGRQLFTTSRDRTVRVWDVETGRELHVLTGHKSVIDSVRCSADGRRLVTASSDGTARVWDAETGAVLLVLREDEGYVCSADFSPDGRWVLTGCGESGNVRVWDARTGSKLHTFDGHAALIYEAWFSPDGRRVVTAGEGGAARVWEIPAKWSEVELGVATRNVQPLAYSPDRRHVIFRCHEGETDQVLVQVRDAATGEELFTLDRLERGVPTAAFAPDGRRIATTATDKGAVKIKIWDAVNRTEIRTLTGLRFVDSVVFSPDGRRLAATIDYVTEQTAQLWDVDTGTELVTLGGRTSALRGVSFSPDGQRLVAADGNAVRVWDADTGAVLLTIPATNSVSNNMAWFAPDGRLVTAEIEGTVRVRDAASGREELTLRGHAALVYQIAFSPDGRRLVTIGRDFNVRVWDMATGAEVFALRRVSLAAFTPDGRRLMTAHTDGTVRVLDSAPDRREVRPRETAPMPRPAE